ncbi:39S ribosomal protein L46, mitochondrial [Harpegnathos saltator]|uniref:Large ribosomal subunit protein mL46 n=1 Tax=Harpegnathos saltator TaxID=610380 RepID=E2C600_HARSA|nr:39S ribosomal protein L46, mitochondrial [Harpegnathos saltator]
MFYTGTSKNTITTCPNLIQCYNVQTFATAPLTKKWDLYSSVCLERHPIITQSMQEIELKFYNMLKKIEFENSLKCDHELKREREQNQQNISITSNIDNKDDTILIQTAQDFEDSNQEELDNFKFAPRITSCDKQNTLSSLKRKLDKNLLLLVHQEIGGKHYWIPPQSIRQEGETMRQTAERVLQNVCGTKIQVKFYGNAPIGFYKYKYPKNLQEKGTYGAKIFYFLAKYIDGDITNNVKYQWLDYEELKKVLPSRIQESISQFMLHI